MLTTLVLLSGSLLKSRLSTIPGISPEVGAEIDRIMEEIMEEWSKLLMPLLLVTSARTLSFELETRLPEYKRIVTRLASQLKWDNFPRRGIWELIKEGFEEVEGLLKTKGRKALSSWEQWHFSSACRGLMSLLEAIASATPPEREQIEAHLTKCEDSLLKAAMCRDGVVLALMNQDVEWKPRSLGILCRAADRYTLQVEDFFLALLPKDIVEKPTNEKRMVSLKETRARGIGVLTWGGHAVILC